MYPFCIQTEEWALLHASAAHVGSLASRVPCSINWVSLAAHLHFPSLVANTGTHFKNTSMCVHTHACVHALRFMYICECAHGGLSSTMEGTQSFSTLYFEECFFTDPRSHQLTKFIENSRVPLFSAMVLVLVLGVHRQTSLWHVLWRSKF